MQVRRTILISLLALLATAGLALLLSFSLNKALAGIWDDTSQSNNQDNDEEEVVVPSIAPVVKAVTELIGDDKEINWAANLTLASVCDLPTPVLSGTVTNLQVAAYPTGYGGLAFEQIANCTNPSVKISNQSDTGESKTLEVTSFGITSSVYSAGDLVIVATGTGIDPQVGTYLVQTLQSNGCLQTTVSPKDATRNPQNPNYAQWGKPTKVTTELPETTLDPGSESAIIEIEEVPEDFTLLPEGIIGPPMPNQPIKPQITYPGTKPESITAEIPTYDPDGPGCGWQFNETKPSIQDKTQIEKDAQIATEAAKQELLQNFNTWETQTKQYLKDLPAYNQQATAWNNWVVTATQTRDLWDKQASQLEKYNKEYQEYLAQMEEYQPLLDEIAQAQATWEAEVKECTDLAIRQNESSAHCQRLAKPTILRQDLPQLPTEPTKPKLWQPEDN